MAARSPLAELKTEVQSLKSQLYEALWLYAHGDGDTTVTREPSSRSVVYAAKCLMVACSSSAEWV
jgi:hypothetical protein